MSYVKETINQRPSAWVGAMQGYFTKDVAAVGDPAYVAVPAFSNTGIEEVEWGPCTWAPEWGGSLPLRGDLALILFDNMRVPWVIKWVPSAYIPVGGGGSDLKYTFTQSAPSTTWTITHNLGVFPAITIVDTSGSVIDADVLYNSNNQITVTFATAQSGKAYLS
jgi:hypothetical protein